MYEYLCFWAYEIYDTEEHPALLQSPRETWTTGLFQSGSRSHRLIADALEFRMLTLPTTTKGKAKVQPGLGVKINYLYYWSNAFRNPEIERTWVNVKYDPFDAGIAYAFVGGQWVQCICQNYADFRGRSEKELRLASIELHKRQQNHARQSTISALKLATFLNSLEAQEALLVQRLRDAEARDVFEVIEQGYWDQSLMGQASVKDIVIDSGNHINESSPEESTSNAPINEPQLELYEEY